MTVFEDLITELKESNLLESTVVEEASVEEDSIDVTMDFAMDEESIDAVEVSADEHDPEPRQPEPETYNSAELNNRGGKDFYKKRAVSEVSGLQMVEHVLTAVEREYMKIVPRSFDDLNAKKALHTFLNAEASSEDHAAAEFSLLQETEAWCTALGERDNSIPVSSLRLFCENSKPALSSQALVALARFYRNLPYTENRRSKFDVIMTRLFSRPTGDEKRACLFGRDDMLGHINTLYKEWSSIPLYMAEEDQSKVLLTALSFDDLAIEAEQASTFDQLIKSDFFSRLRTFKESISELFFAPNVTAAAIECNIRIGNAYVNLIHLEREKMNEESIESKYADLNDQAVSDAAARTLQLVDLLRGPAVEEEEDEGYIEPEVEVASQPAADTAAGPAKESGKEKRELPLFIRRLSENAFAVNKWLLAGAFMLIMASVGIWVWANYIAEEPVSSAGVDSVVLDGILADHIKTGKNSSGMFYGLLGPSWDGLTKEKRWEYAQKVLEAGKTKGYDQVTLIGQGGKVAAYADNSGVDINMP